MRRANIGSGSSGVNAEGDTASSLFILGPTIMATSKQNFLLVLKIQCNLLESATNLQGVIFQVVLYISHSIILKDQLILDNGVRAMIP